MGGATDFLTCGDCQSEFPLSNILVFMQHKKSDCSQPGPSAEVGGGYACYTCPKKFSAAVSLLYHAQFQHEIQLFQRRDVLDPRANPRDNTEPPLQASIQEENGQHAASQLDAADLTEGSCTLPLSKCCTSVVPKKRKRHIETTHRNTLLMRSKLRRQQQQRNGAPAPADVLYIDLDQSSSNDCDGGSRKENGVYVNDESVLLEPGGSYSSRYLGITYSSALDLTSSAGGSRSYPDPRLSAQPITTTANSLRPAQSSTVKSATQGSSSLAMRKKYPTSKPFKCDYCDHSFNQRIHLKKHLSKHTGVKPYKCEQCDYATVERSHLKVHIRIHTGEKPYKCSHCEYATAQNSTLKIHLKRHHGGLLLDCSHCGKSFPERNELIKHKLEHGAAPAVSAIAPPSSEPRNGPPTLDKQLPVMPLAEKSFDAVGNVILPPVASS